MGWNPVSPWKVIQGTGQSLSVSNATASSFTNAVGSSTQAILLSVITANCLVTITHAASSAATATTDVLIKYTDPPMILGCNPGDKVSAYGLAACTLYLAELTH